ncbi:OmpA family protein [Algoriphagus sp. AGSA1]|uniref:OmpA family protein n=1 Tax=Algoriphagus sp. AGSA1 TaxID=2907213 RepID=UPI001F30C20A|nr:OmpA family protein [Algoriphagus sp. AGSA1]MCE7057803.1 OmpA family protein [Algoriphagus sp. AGSA1]
MKTIPHWIALNYIFFAIAMFGLASPGLCQSKFIKDLKKTAEEAAKRTMDRKVEEKTSQATEDAVDMILDAPNIFRSKRGQIKDTEEGTDNELSPENKTSGSSGAVTVAGQFIPDGQVMYKDQFERDALGDFPSKWETNSGGEVVTVDGFKALRTSGTGYYIPNLPKSLPDNYAVEFDLFTYNLDYKTTTPLRFAIHLVSQPTISKAKKGAKIEMPLWYKGASNYFLVESYGTTSKLNNKIPYDYTDKLNDLIHVTLVKNGKRVRLFLDEIKVVDIPTLITDDIGHYIQFYVRSVDLQKDLVVAFANLQITEEGEDLRSKLLKKEGFSTTAILFHTASDQILSSSFEFLNELGTILREDGSIKIQIIGHTDSDGDQNSNQILSENRARAVAAYLSENFGVEMDRLMTLGKGESEPLNENSNANEKAANRRVEFKTF